MNEVEAGKEFACRRFTRSRYQIDFQSKRKITWHNVDIGDGTYCAVSDEWT
ncbi:MAG: hypothetical protein U5K00_01180 [Melioribacteraceae bacterium]|nr:hypothetical protein [Melioribacteraceae bacterium]